MKCKKTLAVLLAVLILCFACSGTAFAATTNGLEVTAEITTANGDTAYVAKTGETAAYIEVLSGGNIWPMDTANPFAATVCTVVDGSGNELGTLESADGVIDWGAYPDAAEIICSTDFTGDVYTVVLADLGNASASPAPAPVQPSDGQSSGGAVNSPLFGKVVSVINVASYVVMVLWVVILVATITRCYKDGIFGAKRRAKKCPVNGVWSLSVTTPHGINEGVIAFSYDGNALHGTLNDKFNRDSKVYEGKMIGSDAFECLVKIDIGMGTAAEFRMKGSVADGKMNGEMVLTAMESIKSTFTAERKG